MTFYRSAASAAAFALLVTVALPVAAQSDAEGEKEAKSGTSTVVLQFKTREVSDEVMDVFYSAVNDGINNFEGTHVVSGGEVTIDELIVTVGCDSPDPDCLAGLNQYVDANRMVFGSVQRSDDVYLFSLKMFDFAEERFVTQVEETTVEGDVSTVKEAIPAVVDRFLYGDIGTAKVDVQGADGANVLFDGQKMGPAPTTLENLPLGQHAVTVETESEEETKMVLLERGEEVEVQFDFGEAEPAATAEGPTEGETTTSGGGEKSGSPVLGFAVTGAGVAAAIVGVVGQVQASSASSELQGIVCGSGEGRYLCPDESYDDAAALTDRVDRLDSQVRTGNALMVAGYSVGVAAMGVGSFLLINHYASGAEREPAGSTAKRLRIQPRRGGLELGISLDF